MLKRLTIKRLWLLTLIGSLSVVAVIAHVAGITSLLNVFNVNEDPVAKIGDTNYSTLQAAFDAASDGDVITLLSNLSQDDGVKLDKSGVSAKLDLNTHTFTVNKGANVNNRAIRIDDGTLEVYGGSIVAVGSGTTSSNGSGCYGAFRVEANGKLIAHDLTLSNARPWGLNVKVLGGEAELTNVTINSSYGGGIEVTEADLGTNSKAGKATLTGCTFTQTGYFDHCSTALSVSGGSELVINSGTYSGEYALYVFSSGGVITVNGGTFTGLGNNNRKAFIAAIDTNTYPQYTGGLQLKGGTFNGGFNITSPAFASVSGGTYSEDPTAYLAEGYKVVDNSGSYTVVSSGVAQIGNTKYATLAAAIAAVPTDGTETTITMLSNETVTAGLMVAAGQNIVLELAGYTISGNSDSSTTYALITNRGTLTIQDNTDTNKDGSGTGKITTHITNPDGSDIPGYASTTITNNGNLTIESGYIENTTTDGWAAYTVDNLTNGGSYTPIFTMNGGKLFNTYTDAVRMFLNSDTKLNKVVINGGILDSNKASGRVIVVQDANAKVNLGELDITGGIIYGKVSAWSAANAGGVEDRFSDTQYPAISINISGGCIEDIDFPSMANETLRAQSLQVTGGVYNVSPETYVSNGYMVGENTDAATKDAFPYKVEQRVVAQIGETTYTSLAAAIAAVPTNGTATTITMLANDAVESGVTVAAGQNIILELNGKTVSGNTISTSSYALITNKGTLTIQDNTDTNKDGTGTGLITTYITNPDQQDVPGYASNTITNNGTLTVKSGKLVNNGSGYACYAIDNQTNGTLFTPVLKIEGGRMEQMNAYTYAVRMFCNSTTNVNSVEVSGGVITGGYGLWLQTPNNKANKASLTISGGEIYANDGAALYIGGTKAVNSEISINITGGTVNGTGVIIQGALSGTYGSVSISDGEFANVQCGANIEKFITGGTFHTDPSAAYIADGYAAAKVGGYWIVGPVSTKELEPVGTPTPTEATYQATTVVTDENNVQHTVATNQEVTVAVQEENNVGEDVTLSDFDMNDVVAKAVAAANTTNKIDVQLIVKAAEPVVSGETVTFEVHPEAIITVNNGIPTNVELTNEDLAQNATFTFKLDVTGRFNNGTTIKVVHKSEGYEDETYYATVTDGKITVSGITHFSDFILSEITPQQGQVAVNLTTGTQYPTLEAAINAATDGQTIALLTDVELGNTEIAISDGRSITLDMNGKNIVKTGTNSAFFVEHGTLNIVGEGTISGTPSNYKLIYLKGATTDVADYSNLTIGENVTVTCTNGYAVMISANSNHAYGVNVTVNGTVQGQYGGLYINGSIQDVSGNVPNFTVNSTATVKNLSTDYSAKDGFYAIYAAGYANWTINGGNIYGGMELKSGTLDVSGGTFTGLGDVAHTPQGSNTSTSGYALSVVNNSGYAGYPAVTVTDGTFNGPVAINDDDNDTSNNTADVAVSGGQFSVVVPEDCCADGYVPVTTPDANGKYTVEKAKVAEVGGVQYETLEAALTAAYSDGTITLLKDVEFAGGWTNAGVNPNHENNGYSSWKLTIDGDGHKITPATGASTEFVFSFNLYNKVDFKDVVFDGWTSNQVLVFTGGMINLDGVTITNTVNSASGSSYGLIRTDNADFTATNCSFTNNTCAMVIGVNIATGGGDVTITNNLFSGNTCDAPGVVYFNKNTSGTKSLTNNTFTGNTVTTSGNGSVVYCSGTVNAMTGNLFSSNNVSVTADKKEGVIVCGGGAGNSVINSNAFDSNTLGTTATHYATIYTSANIDVSNNYWGGAAASESDIYNPDSKIITNTNYATAYAANTESNGATVTLAPVYVAKIGDTYFATLQAALDAAAAQSKTSGEQVTVTLLQNVTDGTGLALFGTAANGANVKIDFGGYTYTVAGPAVGSSGTQNQALHFEEGSNVTLYNGTINMTNDATALAGFEMFMQNYGTLIIDGMNLNGTGIAVATYSDPKYQAYPEWFETEKPQFNYNTAGSSVIRNSTITMPGALGIDDAAALTIEDDAVINVSAIATKGTDARYASATPTIAVENGAQFKLTGNGAAEAFETLLNANGQSLGTADANGVYTVEAAKVAQIGDVKYESLAAAVEAAEAGDVIELIADDYVSLTSGQEITITKAITITGATDEEGVPLYTINGTDNSSNFNDLFIKCTSGTVTISNVAFDGFGNTIASDMGQAPIFIGSANNKVVLNNVYISNINCEGVHINGGEFEITNCYIDCGKETDYDDYTKGICVVNEATGSITGTKIENVTNEITSSAMAGIELQGKGPITISDCEILTNDAGMCIGICADSAEDYQLGESSVTVSNTTVTSPYYTVYGNGTHGALITIESGTYTGDLLAEAGANSQGLSVSGGTFDAPVPEEYCAEGYIPTEQDLETGLYSVKQGSYVAQITVGETTTKYETLQAALDAAVTASMAANGAEITVTVLTDVANGTGLALFNNAKGTYPAANGANVKIDFDGHTYTVAGPAVGSSNTQNQVLHFESGNTITLTNGTINMTNDATALAGFEIFMQNYGTLIIDEMTIDGTGIAVAKYNTAYYEQNFPTWYNTDKPQFNYNTAGSSVIRNSTITVTGDLGIDDNAGLTIEDDAVIYVNKIATKGTDARYDSATPTIAVENGAQFKLTDATGAAAFETLLNANGQSLGTADADGVYTVEAAKVAQIGNVKYASLAAAIAAVADGDEIEMIANSQENVLYDVTSPNLKNKTVTISGAYTLTSTSENFGFYFGDYDSGNRPTTDKLIVSDITMAKSGGNYTTLFDGVTADLTNVTVNGDGNTALSYANGAVGTLTNVTVTNTGNHSQTWRNTALALQGIGAGPSVVTVKSGSYSSTNGYAVYMFSSGGTVNIEGGTFSGALMAQIDNNSYPGNQAIINISGGTFTNCTLTESGGDNAQINVSGGYFSDDPTAYLVPGYTVETLTSSATGDDLAAYNAGAIYKVDTRKVAQIGDVKYASLADAIAAVTTSDATTITMIADETIEGNTGVTIAANKNIVLDLNGKTVKQNVTNAAASTFITNNGTLTIQDNSTNHDGVLIAEGSNVGSSSYSYGNYTINNAGTLNVVCGTVESKMGSGACYAIHNAGTVSISGGKVKGDDTAIRLWCNSTTNTATLTMSGGEIEGIWGVYIQNANNNANKGSMTVTGGTITATTKDCIYVDSNVDWTSGLDVKLQGGTFVANRSALRVMDYGNTPVQISGFSVSGGDFTTTGDALFGGTEGKVLNVISGGTFNKVVPGANCAPGYVPSDILPSGKYTVRLSSTAEIILIDGEDYIFDSDVTVTYSITYRRTFESARVNNYQQWLVPFDYTITSEDLQYFDFFKINVISNSKEEEGGESNDTKVWLHIYKLEAGAVLHANKPYIIRAKDENHGGLYVAGTSYDFVSQKSGDANLTLKGKATDYVHHLNSGLGDFLFYGTYKKSYLDDIKAIAENAAPPFWYLGKDGKLYRGTANFGEKNYSLQPYRWFFICIAERDYAPSFGFIEDGSEATDLNGIEFATDEEIEGYYTLNGVKVQTPGKGVYIVRYNNGKTKKINIK